MYVWGWQFRFPEYNLPCASQRGIIDIHKRRAHKEEKIQEFLGRLTDKAA